MIGGFLLSTYNYGCPATVE